MTREDKLIQQMQQGDAAAAEELVKMYYSEILRYCLWHAPDRFLAQDAAQETFLKALRYFDRYTHKGSFKPFLYRIAANTCIDMHRRSRPPDLSLDELTADPACPDPGFEDVRSDMILRQLVGGLPEELQEIVLLRFGQDLTIREIAKIVDMPFRTVQTRLRSALKRLKKEFEKGGTL